MTAWQFWIDRGGTFTDCIGVGPDGVQHVAKVLSSDDAPAEAIRQILERTAVVVDPMPTAGLVGAPESGHPPDLLGLFVGLPFHEHDASPGGELPPTIFLFQRNHVESRHLILVRLGHHPDQLVVPTDGDHDGPALVLQLFAQVW